MPGTQKKRAEFIIQPAVLSITSPLPDYCEHLVCKVCPVVYFEYIRAGSKICNRYSNLIISIVVEFLIAEAGNDSTLKVGNLDCKCRCRADIEIKLNVKECRVR